MIPFRNVADQDAVRVIETVRTDAGRAGAGIRDLPSSTGFEALADVHSVIMTGKVVARWPGNMTIILNA